MNVSVSERLPEIFSLARSREEGSRVRLAGILADVFLTNDSLSTREQLLVNEIIDELVGHASPQVKQMLSERLALSDTVPHRVLLSLACDTDPQVAHPILAQNLSLKDEDLIFVVEAHGTEHALAVAERKAISEAVVDALVATGDISVMSAVAANLGAVISTRTMNVLVEASRFAKKLHEPLTQRPELTADMAQDLYWWLGTELRRVTGRKFGITPGQIDQALEHAINDLLTNCESDRHDRFAMEKVAEWFEERDAISPRVMIQCLRMGFFSLFHIMMARKTGLDVALVEMMTTEDGGKAMSALAKACCVDKPSFVSMFLLSRGAREDEHIVNPRELSGALSSFDKLDMSTAKQMVAQWRDDPSYLLSRLKHSVH